MSSAITESSGWTTPVYRPDDGDIVTGDSVGDPLTQLVQRSNYVKGKIEGTGISTPFIEVASVSALKALTGMINSQYAVLKDGDYANSVWRFQLAGTGANSYRLLNANDASGVWLRLDFSDVSLNHYTTLPTVPSDVSLAIATSTGRCLNPNIGAQIAIGMSDRSVTDGGDTSGFELLGSIYAPSLLINGASAGPPLATGDMVDISSTLTHRMDLSAPSTTKYVVGLRLELLDASSVSLVTRDFYMTQSYCSPISGTDHYSSLSGHLTYQLTAPTNYVIAKVYYYRLFIAESSTDIDVEENTSLKVSRP